MFTLSPTDTLSGIAGTTLVINWMAFGDRLTSGPTDNFEVIGKGTLTNAIATLIPALAGSQRAIGTFVLKNTLPASVTGILLYVNGVATADTAAGLTIPASGMAVGSLGGWKVYDSDGSQVTTAAGGTADNFTSRYVARQLFR